MEKKKKKKKQGEKEGGEIKELEVKDKIIE